MNGLPQNNGVECTLLILFPQYEQEALDFINNRQETFIDTPEARILGLNTDNPTVLNMYRFLWLIIWEKAKWKQIIKSVSNLDYDDLLQKKYADELQLYQKTKPAKRKTMEFGMKLISSTPSAFKTILN